MEAESGADSFDIPEPFHWVDIDAADEVPAGASSTYDVPLAVPREYIFVCVSGERLFGVDDLQVTIDNADQSVVVTE